MTGKKIKVLRHGPYQVTGNVPLKQEIIIPDEQRQSVAWESAKEYETDETYHLCRCGHSKNKPFCDGSHVDYGFTGEETASFDTFEQNAKLYKGPVIDMLDNKAFCAVARFCDRGNNAWIYVRHSDDPECEQLAIEEASACPAGRLVIIKDGKMVEPELEQEIGLVQDVAAGRRGPLWIKGRIEVESASGKSYEVRNRVTLCRCGKSENMPFCDAKHVRSEQMKGFDE